MSQQIDEMKFECSECGTPFRVRLSKIKPGYLHTCKYCGTQIEFTCDDLSKLGQGLIDLDKAMSLN